ncbi:MAG: hypothetical protein JWO57_817 [Pseudonocardiales bacterium]|nr:hypothetical protein [Pseudonocardiales bacterium]
MYARSTTIIAQPGSIDAGIKQVHDEVLPALRQLDGFIGLSMMVNRESGRCIATSAWASQDDRHASARQVEPVRNRVAEILGGRPEVEDWDIAVMHRDQATHDGAYVRSAWFQAGRGGVDAIVDVFKNDGLPQIEQMDGFCSASLMIDRDTGRAVASICFENKATLDASRENANQVRTAAISKANATILEVDEFELAVAHLRVPEMV